jgi:hypothetical protein
MADDYEIGYRKPPKYSQFRTGRSGNPKGRPKGSRNLEGLFRRICNEKVKVNGPRGPQYMTKLEASLTQLVNKAASGDVKAIREVVYINSKFPDFLEPLPPVSICIGFVEAEDGKPKYRFDKDGNEQPREEFLKSQGIL